MRPSLAAAACLSTPRRVVARCGYAFSLPYRAPQLSRGLHRGPFKHLTGEDVEAFRTLLGEGGEQKGGEGEGKGMTVLTKEEDTEPYDTDWMGKYKGRSSAVLRPGCPHQVAAVLKYCHEQRIAVVPQVS